MHTTFKKFVSIIGDLKSSTKYLPLGFETGVVKTDC